MSRPATAAPVTRGRRPWSINRRLVTGIAVVVAAVLAAVGVISVVTLSATVTTVVDTQLTGSMSALSHTVERVRYPNAAESASGDQKPVKPLVDYVGHGPGGVIALLENGTVVDSARFSDSDAAPLDEAVVQQLETTRFDVGSYQNVDLAGLGSYRIVTELDTRGNLLVAGVSLATVQAAVMREAVTIGLLALLGLAIIVVGVVVVVRLALRPLGRVVATAAEVASMPLDRGEVAITPRVDAADTDPRTEVGKVGEALNHLLAHVDDALAVRAETDKRMRRFVTDASHELRTPLAAIQGYAELTRQDNADLPDITEYSLARIESEAKRMNSLVSDLLLLARLDEGQDLHLDRVDLNEIVVNAVSDAGASWPGHSWAVAVPDEPVPVLGDRERLHQLVLNLLSNAAVHTPAGTRVATEVSLRVASGAGGAPGTSGGAIRAGADEHPVIELTVADDGPGISPELVPELFERFARGDSSRSRRSGSTGLGLAIVSSIVEAHEGSISVESSPSGTVFTVRLAPVVPAAGVLTDATT